MTQQNKNVPKLRFPEFSGEWSENSFGSIFDFQPTNSFSRALLNYENGTVKNIHYGDIHTNYKSLFDISKEEVPYINPSVDISKIKNDAYLKEGDVVIADASEDYADIGKAIEIIHLNNQSTVAGLHTYIARPKSAPQPYGFYGNILKTFSVRKQVMKLATGASVLGISKTNYAKVILKTPHEIEQQKIADFLSAVDERVDGLRRKKELLERYKKGVMQKIFSQEIRFTRPDGTAYPDWEEKRLGEVFAERSERENANFELLSVTMNSGVVKRSDIEGKDNSSADKSNYKLVEINDLPYNSMRMWQGACGVSPFKGIVSPAYTVLKPKKGCLSKYFGYFFKTTPVIQIFQRNSQGLTSDTWNLKYPQFSKIKFNVPHIDEQKVIADFLTSVDKKVEATAFQLEEAQKFKKALLQQMFV